MSFIDPEYKQKLIERLEGRHEKGRLSGIFTLGRHYTPEEIIQEAKRGTPAGEEFLIAEKKLMDELKRRM